MLERLIELFAISSNQFLCCEKELILSGVSERCLCGALMLIIRNVLDSSEFRNYYPDIEYNRNFDGRIKTILENKLNIVEVTCDLIVHSRGNCPVQDNLMAIEMKRDTHNIREKNKDRVRLRALTTADNNSNVHTADGRTMPQHVCGYIVGVFYEISIAKRSVNIEYYRDGELLECLEHNF